MGALADLFLNVVLAVAVGAEGFATVCAGVSSDSQVHAYVIANIAVLIDLAAAD